MLDVPEEAQHGRWSRRPSRPGAQGRNRQVSPPLRSAWSTETDDSSRDRIENALPGREGFDIEIYGMEGVPAADLADWKKRQAEESGVPLPDDQQRPKKPRFAQVALTPAEAKAQLAAHRALMGLVPNVAAVIPTPLAAPAAPTPIAPPAMPAPVPGMPG